MSSLAIIPARGGSKRIPRKNIRDFFGKPIIVYSIEAAISSNLFDEVMVSTDDNEIASIAKQHGAKVPFMRSIINADDFATLPDVIKEVLEKYGEKKRYFDNICCIMPANPLIKKDIIIDSYDKFKIKNGESMIAVIKSRHHIQKTFQIKNELLSFSFPNYFSKRSQDLDEYYYDAGSFFWVTLKAFTKYKKGITNKTIPYFLDEMKAQDIDNLSDFKLAELKYQIMQNE